MKLNEAEKIVRRSVKQDVVAMLWGPVGIGKSSVVHQIAKSLDRDMIDIRLAQLEPTDLRGIPMPDTKTAKSTWCLPDFWPERSEKEFTRTVKDKKGKAKEVKVKAGNCVTGPGIIFFDEIEKAPVSVKNAALQVVLDRKIGTYKLPDDWGIVCAGNRLEDRAFSQPLGSALSNRMIHLNVDADVDTWAQWAREHDVSEDIIGFLHYQPHYLYKDTGDHAFPSPRSWVIGSNLIQGAKNSKEQKVLLETAIGKGTASEFRVWQDIYKDVDPAAVLKGEMPDFKGKGQDFKYAVALSVAFYLRKRKENIKGIEKHVAQFLKMLTAELRVVFLRQQTLGTLEKMIKNENFKELTKEVMKIIV